MLWKSQKTNTIQLTILKLRTQTIFDNLNINKLSSISCKFTSSASFSMWRSLFKTENVPLKLASSVPLIIVQLGKVKLAGADLQYLLEKAVETPLGVGEMGQNLDPFDLG